MSPPSDAVTIRMYRHILGDCFVLTVTRDGKRQVTVIDCGVLQNVKDGATLAAKLPEAVLNSLDPDKLSAVRDGNDSIRAVVADVISYVKEGKPEGAVDVLVVTHEHFDHISGFALASELWMDLGLEIRQLWMAWTEKPEDDPALRDLREGMLASKRAIQKTAIAADFLGAAGDSEEMAAVKALADFLGPMDDPHLAAAGGIPSTAQTMRMLKEKVGRQRTRYLEPGEVIAPELGGGLKAYILGPPHDVRMIKKDLPSGGPAKEVYLTKADQAAVVDAGVTQAVYHAQLAAAGNAGSEPTRAPFEAANAKAPFDRTRLRPYVFSKGKRREEIEGESDARRKLRLLYENKANDELRIEDEWLAAAESLALKLDSDTNNTSLVIAFELPDAERSILLFAADAQVGNWLSWGSQVYPSSFEGDKPAHQPTETPQTIDQLLSRVSFYKVGHHASHNATLRERGLELMPDGLVAAIPVVETVAKVQGKGRKEPGRGWQMPFPHLYSRLEEKTYGRIVRADGDPEIEQQKFNDPTHPPRRPVTVRHDPKNDLWVEIEFSL